MRIVNRHKALLIIADGMADRPIEELNWKTPLEAANKPTLNEIARKGVCGIIDVISPGIPPGSDTAMLSLLGYDAAKVYSGRGPLEAIGSGIEILPKDIALRCNFATVDENFVVLDRRAGRIANEEAAKLAESLKKVKLKSGNVEFLFKNTVEHRAVLVLRGNDLSSEVSDSDPEEIGKCVQKIKPLDESYEAKRTAEILNELMQKFHEVLKTHQINEERIKRKLPPANAILLRGAGVLPKVEPVQKIYGINATCISATSLIRGVCKAVGIKVLSVKGATGTLETDLTAKAKAAVEALETNDFVILHVKATDIASHDGSAKQKIKLIEKIDDMMKYLLSHVDLGTTYVAVTADHTTSVITGNHEGDPVPVVIAGPYVRCDDVKEFSERSCAKGGLNRIKGRDLMPILMNLIGKTRKFGA